MDAKLTLKLDKNVIEKAKEYAAENNRSLSRLIESYLISLLENTKPQTANEAEISPYVKSLKLGITVDKGIDYKTEYKKHLDQKYQ